MIHVYHRFYNYTASMHMNLYKIVQAIPDTGAEVDTWLKKVCSIYIYSDINLH